jgi:hypothetical protein
MRWQYRDPLLVWLMPAAYGLHILEEWFGGFPEWLTVLGRNPLPRNAFVVINAMAFTTMILAARAAVRREAQGWMAVAIATILLTNGLAHLFASLGTGSYSPGLFTGVILYLPLGNLALLRAWEQAGASFARGVWMGLGLHALVAVIAIALTRV